jgi:hypothetical protein
MNDENDIGGTDFQRNVRGATELVDRRVNLFHADNDNFLR